MRRLVLIIALLVAGAAAILADTRWWVPSISQSVARGAGGAAIRVMTDQAMRADVPIFLTGLGTVQAFNSVLIKSRVDGQIVKIRYEEGKGTYRGPIDRD